MRVDRGLCRAFGTGGAQAFKIPNGDAFLKRLGFDDVSILEDCIVLIAMSFIFRIGSYLCLKHFYWDKK